MLLYLLIKLNFSSCKFNLFTKKKEINLSYCCYLYMYYPLCIQYNIHKGTKGFVEYYLLFVYLYCKIKYIFFIKIEIVLILLTLTNYIRQFKATKCV